MMTTLKKTQWKLMPHLDWSEISESERFVLFYDTDQFLLDSLSSFIGAGLDVGDACIVLATKVHRESLEERLKANGRDLTAARAQGEYTLLDADETLSNFMVGGLPDPKLFAEVVGSLVMQAAKGRPRVRIFGEMVALLWVEGNHAASFRLEELWNDLCHTIYPFSLLCAYPMHDFAGDVYRVQFTEICEHHSLVISDESTAAASPEDEHLCAITLLQQKANSLQAEIAEERKAAQDRLQISENRYRRLFDASRDGIVMIDPCIYTITDVNPFMTELLGYTREQLLGQELWQIGLFQDQQATLEALQELQEKRFICYEALPLYDKEGQRRYVEFVCNMYQENGYQVVQCNIRDITGTKRAKAALQASEERFRMLANQAPLMIWQYDAATASIYVNTTWYQFTGLSEEESLRAGWMSVVHPEDRDTVISLWTRVIAPHAPYRVQFRLRRSDGVYRYVLAYGNACFDPEGAFTGYIGTILDVTEQAQAE